MIHRVFAYGSNMNVLDLRSWMQRRGFEDASIRDSRSALLEGWRLVWNYRSPARNGGAANVEQERGALLPGVVLDLDDRGLAAIDRKEGHPGRYDRGEAPVELRVGDVTVRAWLYVVGEVFREPQRVCPRGEYVSLMIEGALAHNLPAWHIEALRGIETAD